MGCIPHAALTRIVALGVLGVVVGCAPPRVVYRPAADVVAEEKGNPLQVRLTTGEQFLIASSRVSNDTLYASRLGADSTQDVAIVVPVNRIASLTSTEGGLNAAGAGAAGLFAGVVVGVVGLVFLLLMIPST
jgi:hypothetical protein